LDKEATTQLPACLCGLAKGLYSVPPSFLRLRVPPQLDSVNCGALVHYAFSCVLQLSVEELQRPDCLLQFAFFPDREHISALKKAQKAKLQAVIGIIEFFSCVVVVL
jgi:hypothetical protein